MPERSVNAGPERIERRIPERAERLDRGMALAAIVQALPWFVWAAPVVLVFGFIILALWFNRGDGLKHFTSSVLFWFSMVPIVAGVVLGVLGIRWCYRFYNQCMLDATARRVARAGVTKALAAARQQELKNEQLQAKIELEKQLPYMMQWALQNGYHAKYGKDGLEISQAPGVRVMEQGNNPAQLGAGGASALSAPADNLPTTVRYEDIQDQIPRGHALLGVSGRSVETCEFGELMTMWICGGSNTGKSNTVGIKIDEAISNGRRLGIICIDYHFRKPDSLYNKIRVHEDRFLLPVATNEQEALAALHCFYAEFMKRREVGSGERDILLVVDEVPAVLESEDEEIAPLLKKIARICGRESRGFGMFGWFISQNAVGLAWLRNVVLTVIAHKMNMLNEAELACNQHKDIARGMEHWPKGRVVVYGLNFIGIKVLQMPLLTQQTHMVGAIDAHGDTSMATPLVDAEDVSPQEEQEGSEEKAASPVPALTGDLRRVYDACIELINRNERVSSRAVEAITGIDKDKANGLMNRLADLGYITRRKAV